MTMPECTECGTEFDHESLTGGRVPKTCSQKCRRARRTRQNEQSRQRAITRGCPEHLHGTSAGYTFYMCDCTKCCAWGRGDKRQRREAFKEGA